MGDRGQPRAGSWGGARRVGQTAGALVIGGGHVGLGLARSLGRHGVPVWIAASWPSLPGVSRYCRRRLPWPDGDQARQQAYLLSLADQYHLDEWTLLPTADEVAALLARYHATLSERFLVTVPPWETLRWAYDKRLTYALAAEHGVGHPATQYPRDRADVAALDAVYPLILKPAIKEGHNAFTSGKAWHIRDREDLLARYDEACVLVPPDTIMVQEMIPAGASAQFSFAALCADGRPLAWVEARRLRQYPPSFGVATYVETIREPAIEAPARRFLAAMRYTGLVEMDFVRDPRDGSYHLLDVNARPWSWHALGRRAGVDFPYLLWRQVHGQPVHERRGRTGARWIHGIPDTQTALRALRKGALDPSTYLRSLRPPLEGAVLALDDPLPALFEAPLILSQRLPRR